MRALVIKQPHLNLILDGHKTIETRTWSIHQSLGDFLLIAGQRTYEGKVFVGGEDLDTCELLRRWHLEEKPLLLGKACAVVRFTTCRLMTVHDEAAACFRLYPGAQAWLLEDVRPIKPFEVRGQQGIFYVEEEGIEFITSHPVAQNQK